MGDRVVHFEVGAKDHGALVRFYGDLFGWRITAMGDAYATVDTVAGTGVGGGVGRSNDGTPWVAFYVAVDDPGAVLDRAAVMGGATLMPVMEIPGAGTFAMLSDPDGNPVGLAKAGEPRAIPAPATGDGPPVDWFEVLGTDAERTQRFYCELFGWTVDPSGFPGYRLVDTGAGDGAIGGGLGAGSDGRAWPTVYARVPDVEAALAKAERLGGTREYGPNTVDDHMRTGAFRDPAGNVFGVYEHEHGDQHEH